MENKIITQQDKTINDLPFQEELNNNTVIHTFYDKVDYKSTLERLWRWIKAKCQITTRLTGKMISLVDGNQEPFFISPQDFLKETLEGLLNTFLPVDYDALLKTGFKRSEIILWELTKLSASPMPIYSHIEMSLSQSDFDELMRLPLVKETGFAFCDGQNGTPDMRGMFARVIDTGAGRDEGRQLGSYQEDTMQRIEGDFWRQEASYGGEGGVFYKEGYRPCAYTGRNPWSGEDRHIVFDSARVTRTSHETRPKNYSVARFTKIRSLDWQLVPNQPKKFS